jgi:hypothetical protein
VLKQADKPSGLGGGEKGKKFSDLPDPDNTQSESGMDKPNRSVEVRTLPLQQKRSLKL